MNKLVYTLLIVSSFASFSSISALSNEQLAQEVAHCYVANQRGPTELFKSGEAEKMRLVIADLIGSDNINKTIQIAARIQARKSLAGNAFVHKDIKKFCRPLDEMLIDNKK